MAIKTFQELGYGLGDQGSTPQNGNGISSLRKRVQTGCGSHPAS